MYIASKEDRHVAAPAVAETARLLDPKVFEEFVNLFGKAQARYWLDDFRAALLMEFFARAGRPDPDLSRANMHRLCSRAGITGFVALHQACLAFLEENNSEDDNGAAYEQARLQAKLAVPEIEEQCLRLS